ncbi:hypothetical protein Tco_0300413 [Tanacetum coccineum]
MSPLGVSHGVVTVLATTIAVSGTMIFLSLLRTTTTTTTNTFSIKNCDLNHAESPPQTPRRRSCLSSKKKDRKIKKKVRFAENVMDIEYVTNCGSETMDFNGARSSPVELAEDCGARPKGSFLPYFSNEVLDTNKEDREADKTNDKGKAIIADDELSKPFKEVLKCPFTRRIIKFSAPKLRMPTNVKIYDGTEDPDDHISRFTGFGNQEEWPMPPPKEILAIEHQLHLSPPPLLVGAPRRENKDRCYGKDREIKSMLVYEDWMNVPITFTPVAAENLSEEPLTVEAEIEGYLIRMIHVDKGASIEIMYEHCFNNLHPTIRERMTET